MTVPPINLQQLRAIATSPSIFAAPPAIPEDVIVALIDAAEALRDVTEEADTLNLDHWHHKGISTDPGYMEDTEPIKRAKNALSRFDYNN